MILWTIFFIIVILVMTVKIYQKLTHAICKSSAHMVGKVVIVTGANSGLGFEVAKDLAFRGARVIMACRNMRLAEAAKELIVKETGNTDVHCRQLDLGSLRSVREFCDNIIKTEKRIDVLINNAASGGLGNYTSEDGLQIGMQVNFYASFLLTCLLLPLLKKSAPSRIINLSSLIHHYGILDFDNLNMEKYWSDQLVYANSKLFMNLMTLELSKRLKATGVTVNAVHPGVSATNIFRNIPYYYVRCLVERSIRFMFQTPWEASQTCIYLAVSPEVSGVSGKYFSDCRQKKPSKTSQDGDAARRLWAESERLVKFTLPEK
ncbi:retinol dehydrogenase 13-like [Amyelois transitella]|uniref:retinol dehydrogenase 13-like n=1 Tax=Amyelois transitella TaxID=680683 RepID=UPI00299068A5|nr:retinol dehydrogenase 13-like [Amyelois transitella]XP_060801854.1 retinol dehydrogenase 13-like [Amyelois transitella]